MRVNVRCKCIFWWEICVAFLHPSYFVFNLYRYTSCIFSFLKVFRLFRSLLTVLSAILFSGPIYFSIQPTSWSTFYCSFLRFSLFFRFVLSFCFFPLFSSKSKKMSVSSTPSTYVLFVNDNTDSTVVSNDFLTISMLCSQMSSAATLSTCCLKRSHSLYIEGCMSIEQLLYTTFPLRSIQSSHVNSAAALVRALALD